jgi:hypothetical protein
MGSGRVVVDGSPARSAECSSPAILGTPPSPLATLAAYLHALLVVAGLSLLAGLLGVGLLATRPARSAQTIAPTPRSSVAGEGA